MLCTHLLLLAFFALLPCFAGLIFASCCTRLLLSFCLLLLLLQTRQMRFCRRIRPAASKEARRDRQRYGLHRRTTSLKVRNAQNSAVRNAGAAHLLLLQLVLLAVFTGHAGHERLLICMLCFARKQGQSAQSESLNQGVWQFNVMLQVFS